MSIFVDDVPVHDRCLNAGVEITYPPTKEPWGVREMHVRHPDEHVSGSAQDLAFILAEAGGNHAGRTCYPRKASSGVRCWPGLKRSSVVRVRSCRETSPTERTRLPRDRTWERLTGRSPTPHATLHRLLRLLGSGPHTLSRDF
jgi:hypothetical protein